MKLPQMIESVVAGKPYTCDHIGKSGSQVRCYADAVLKIEPAQPRFSEDVQMLRWLQENKPPLEPVLSHGDFCLPNVFFENGSLSGVVDLGDCGISDKWRDIALCYRSLRHNLSGKYANKPIDYDPDTLFQKLGIAPDPEKLRYHTLLDELF